MPGCQISNWSSIQGHIEGDEAIKEKHILPSKQLLKLQVFLFNQHESCILLLKI